MGWKFRFRTRTAALVIRRGLLYGWQPRAQPADGRWGAAPVGGRLPSGAASSRLGVAGCGRRPPPPIADVVREDLLPYLSAEDRLRGGAAAAADVGRPHS